MRPFGKWARGLAWVCVSLVGGELCAQGALASQASKNWAWDCVKSWSYYRKDARGQTIWQSRKFFDLTYAEQTKALVEKLDGGADQRRAALIVLGDRPVEQWAKAALATHGDPDEVALFLLAKNYRLPDKDPYGYLDPVTQLGRPWTQGLGLHLDGGGKWRFQWIPSPVLMTRLDAGTSLPKALELVPQPGVLLRLKQLRPGLARIQALAGHAPTGAEAGASQGIIQALANGSRAGFFLRHVDAWLKNTSTALEPLGKREAWVLHYGLSRESSSPLDGTLVFLPGDLPTRTQLALDLLRLNPTSMGARSRSITWKGPGNTQAQITQVRGAGGVLSLYATAEGTWISDRENTLRAVAFPAGRISMGERAEWGRIALAGVHSDTEASLWIAPRLGAGAAFEREAMRRRSLGLHQQSWNNPFIAKAAARGGDLALSLGAGPTSDLIQSILRVDNLSPIAEASSLPADGSWKLNSEQRQAYEKEQAEVSNRRQGMGGLRRDIEALTAQLDLRGAALYWKGWVAAPALTATQKDAKTEFQKLQIEGPGLAARKQTVGAAAFYGGFAEPGMSPSLALAVPIQANHEAAVEGAIRKFWPRLFKGRTENREYAKGVVIHRIRTQQAFTPSYAIVGGNLVLGSDDVAVQAVAAGLLGQGPSLADYQSKAFGIAEVDGPSLAKDLEFLLLAYLRMSLGGRHYWFGQAATDDDASAEVASTFGPFLGAIRDLGTQTLELEWTSGGLEARPR